MGREYIPDYGELGLPEEEKVYCRSCRAAIGDGARYIENLRGDVLCCDCADSVPGHILLDFLNIEILTRGAI